MTPDQTATNNRIVMAAAARLETAGVMGDPFEVAKQLIDGALREGYRPIERPVPLRGPGGSERARREALEACRKATDPRRHTRTTTATEGERP